MNIAEIAGKRLKSNSDQVMFWRFPGSQETKTLVAGKPSPKIQSYLPSGFYELEGTSEKNLYIKDTKALEVVEADEKDESGFFDSVTSGLFDTVSNVQKKAVKNAGFLSDGFSESVGKLSVSAFDFTKDLRKIALAAGVAIALIITYKIWKI